MLRLSKMTDYGTVVVTTMIREPARVRSTAEIARAIRVPVPTVRKILKILARGGLVVSLRGAKGGYLLFRPATEISLAEIVHAMDGLIGMTECSDTSGLCAQETGCAVCANRKRVNQAALGMLRGITLDQRAEPVAQKSNGSTVILKRTPPKATEESAAHSGMLEMQHEIN